MRTEWAQIDHFDKWLAKTDLKHLEDVRWYVREHALQNCSDVPKDEIYATARLTVESYIDDPGMAEVFNDYR